MNWRTEMVKALEIMLEAFTVAATEHRLQGAADTSVQGALMDAMRLRAAVNKLDILAAVKQFAGIEKVYYALFEEKSLVRMAWAVDRLAEDKSA